MKLRVLFCCIALASLMVQVSHAGVKKEIRFNHGSTTAVVKESVIRGERDYYYLTARAGQNMEVRIRALEDNAAFTIYKPGYRIGADEIKGETLPRAGEMDDATRWIGRLPASGRYLFVVGGTRGNATYEMTITVR